MPLILIVDNDPAAALVTQHGLQRLLAPGADVQIAHSPGAAWLRCVRGHVDLVITDPNPQNPATAALLKALRDQYPQVPVLVLTAYDTPGLRNQMRALGVQHYFAKPIALRDLEHAIRVALGLDVAAATT